MKLVSLNTEGRKHWELIEPFLEQEYPDVICLQEILATDVERVAGKLSMSYVFLPMTLKHAVLSDNTSPLEPQGVAIFSRAPMTNIQLLDYYRPSDELVAFDKSSMEALRKTMRHGVIIADVTFEGNNFTVATTHFPVTVRGIFDETQRVDIEALLTILEKSPNLVLCGDFNAPRGLNEVYDRLAARYEDAIPKSYATSIDLSIHRAKDNPVEVEQISRFMVDYLFFSEQYAVSDVRLQFGVSDHAAVVASIGLRA